jgi:DNA-binding NarL/FixJ family response regulator
MIKILVVDDHAIVRAGVKHLLNDVEDMEVAGEASTAADAIKLIRAESWDIVLLDINLPDKNGVEILDTIKRINDSLPVLYLSMHPETRYATQILRAGAAGYLQKEALGEELVGAIRTVMQGHKHISFAVADLLTVPPDQRDVPLHETLSKREQEIFRHLAAGDSVTKIGEDLCLSVKTVSTYRSRILTKMNMTNNAELIYYAIKQNLVE